MPGPLQCLTALGTPRPQASAGPAAFPGLLGPCHAGMLCAGPPRAHLPPGGIPRPWSPGVGRAVDALASPAPRLSPRGSRPASPTRLPFSLPPHPSRLPASRRTHRPSVSVFGHHHLITFAESLSPVQGPTQAQGSGPMSSGPPFPRSTPVKTRKQPHHPESRVSPTSAAHWPGSGPIARLPVRGLCEGTRPHGVPSRCPSHGARPGPRSA